jgi:hypothetical protein
MGEVLQDSESYVIHCNAWMCARGLTYDCAFELLEKFKRSDLMFGRKNHYSIIKETTKREVVYND